MRYLVTGCTGYIGRTLLQRLVNEPNSHVVGLDMKIPPGVVSELHGWYPVEMAIGDPNLPKVLAEAQPDVVFHAAAAPRTATLSEQLGVNVLGTQHLLESLVEAQIQAKTVVLGSAAEYGLTTQTTPIEEDAPTRPLGDYGVAKLSQTHTALVTGRRYDIPVIVGRLFNVYGYTPNTFVVASLASQIAQLEHHKGMSSRIKVKNMLAIRDFIHVSDVVSGLIALGLSGKPHEIYHIASAQGVSTQWILDYLLQHSSITSPEVFPQGKQLRDVSIARINKINIHTGWKPLLNLTEGLDQELQYWREQVSLAGLAR